MRDVFSLRQNKAFNRMQIIFRVDASKEIGSGHVMRCLTLANYLAVNGHKCTFVSRNLPQNLIDLTAQKYRCFALPKPDRHFAPQPNNPKHASWASVDWRLDASETKDVIGSCDWLVVDHYAFDHRWEYVLRDSAGRILVLDDLADRKHSCDALLDHALGRRPNDYHSITPQRTKILTGPENFLLRPEFSLLRESSLVRRKNAPLKSLLVSMGGFDPGNTIPHILAAISKVHRADEFHVMIVVSKAASNLSQIRTVASEMPYSCDLHVSPSNLVGLFCDADLAISASGMTAYELASLGVPMLLLPLSDIQETVASELAKISEAWPVVGWQNSPVEKIHESLENFTYYLKEMPFKNRRIAQTLDGCGASRVVKMMENFRS
jgi:UDP-2,4-diacetamido-2,4,6-trideoxy-beta-L-altropyranose hydrolase